jgi:hypothetical protein
MSYVFISRDFAILLARASSAIASRRSPPTGGVIDRSPCGFLTCHNACGRSAPGRRAMASQNLSSTFSGARIAHAIFFDRTPIADDSVRTEFTTGDAHTRAIAPRKLPPIVRVIDRHS